MVRIRLVITERSDAGRKERMNDKGISRETQDCVRLLNITTTTKDINRSQREIH
jgi:hypothetical protein